MQNTNHRSRAIWLFTIAAGTIMMIILGGLVRLTGSGLSITEWDLITGVIPPVGEQAWEEAFAQYQESPQFEQVNFDMTLDEYEFIYYMEYLHRLLGRLLGLVYVIPLFYMLATKRLVWSKSLPYLWIGLGLAFQGWLGWYMVASGLIDRPEVSHYRLTAHLLSALILLGLAYWVGLGNLVTAKRSGEEGRPLRRLAVWILGVYFVQVAYGGLVAGLKAGHVSNTWPRMFGVWLPRGLLSTFDTWYQNLFGNPTTVHFIHRWFAFVVLGLAVWLWVLARDPGVDQRVKKAVAWTLGFVLVQVGLGISVVLFNVPVLLASLHQASAIGIYLSILTVLHGLRRGGV